MNHKQKTGIILIEESIHTAYFEEINPRAHQKNVFVETKIRK